MMARRKALPADVRQGTQAQAQWYSYSVNQTNGLRRTNQDKRRAVLAAMAHPNGAKLSDMKIAEHVGVDGKMVAKYRPAATPEVPKSTLRTGRDGRTINTANIGKGRAPALPALPTGQAGGRQAGPTAPPAPATEAVDPATGEVSIGRSEPSTPTAPDRAQGDVQTRPAHAQDAHVQDRRAGGSGKT